VSAGTAAPRASTSVAPTRRRDAGPTVRRVVAAEWARATGLRSTAVLALAAVACSGVLTALFAGSSAGDPGFDPTRHLTEAAPLTAVVLLVLGVHLATGDARTGAFRTTYVVVPRRLLVLAAQVVVTAALATLLAVAAVGAAVLGVLPAGASRGMVPDLLGDGMPRELAASGVHLVAMALLGLGVGALVRRTVPALVAVLGVVLVAPVLLGLAADLASDPLAESRAQAGQVVEEPLALTPVDAGARLAEAAGRSATDPADLLGPAGVLAAWVLVPLAGAAVRLRRSDLC
jgi:ABC-2 type transport system permease protein